MFLRSSVPVPRTRRCPDFFKAEPAICFTKSQLTQKQLTKWLRNALRDARRQHMTMKSIKPTHVKKQHQLQKIRAQRKAQKIAALRSATAFTTGVPAPHEKLPEVYAAGARVHVDTSNSKRVVWEAELVMQDRATNTDKFYFVAVYSVTGKTKFVLFQNWGRTGTKGQVRTSEFSAVSGAQERFSQKFFEKTGQKWATATTGTSSGSGKYNYLAKDYSVSAIALQATEASTVKWQYDLVHDPLGKPDGWYDYDGDATTADTATFNMEGFYLQHVGNSFLDIRFVQSGSFTYKIDFSNMTQTNTTSNKTRPIRRFL